MQSHVLKRTWLALVYAGRRGSGAAPRAAPGKHRLPIVVLHWAAVVAIVVGVAAVWLRDATEDAAARLWLMDLHRQLGMLVLVGVAFRIAVRQRFGLTNYAPAMGAPLRWGAVITHVALYSLSIALPLLGWAATNAHHVTFSLFGLVNLPALVAADPDLADTLDGYHSLAAWALLGFVSLHVIAALWHHFVVRDQVLSAMLPGRARRRAASSSRSGAK